MVFANVIFDDNLHGIDIIGIPDHLASNIHKIFQDFLDWLPPIEDTDYWVFINGRNVLLKETNNFIKWLNCNYCDQEAKAIIVETDTTFRPEYISIEF